MKFKTDENLPTEAADLLRSAGHDAVTVGEQRLGGAVDSTVGSVCQREGRVLVTLDLDLRTSVLIRRAAIRASWYCVCRDRTRPAS